MRTQQQDGSAQTRQKVLLNAIKKKKNGAYDLSDMTSGTCDSGEG